MKIIVSHDVDHLFNSDHLKDLVYPKLWVRETLEFIRGGIPFKEWLFRMCSPFKKNRNHIEKLLDFDEEYGVKSTFFFGMEKGLGMSYDREKALPLIKLVADRGFHAGVHGINYTDANLMKREFDLFRDLTGKKPKGIRMHYVRYDDETFKKLSDCGYIFDSTEFDKEKGTSIKSPYKSGAMWEFPLSVMDGYLPHGFEAARTRTLEILAQAKEQKIEYFTVLFHDFFFCKAWGETEKWYRWMIEYFAGKPEYEFISFTDAVLELENKL